MQPMTIPEIVSAVDGTWLDPREGAAPVTAVCTDSRKIAPGCLFLPMRGGEVRRPRLHRQGPGRRRRRVPVRPGAGDAAARQVLHPGGGHPPGPAGPGVRLPGPVRHPLRPDHRQRGQDHHEGDAGRRAGGEAPGAEDAGELQQRHRHPSDPAGPGAGAPGGGDRDRHEPLRGDPLPGGDGAAGHRRHLQHRRRPHRVPGQPGGHPAGQERDL